MTSKSVSDNFQMLISIQSNHCIHFVYNFFWLIYSLHGLQQACKKKLGPVKYVTIFFYIKLHITLVLNKNSFQCLIELVRYIWYMILTFCKLLISDFKHYTVERFSIKAQKRLCECRQVMLMDRSSILYWKNVNV